MARVELAWADAGLSGSQDSQSLSPKYVVLDVADEAEAMSAALAACPATLYGIPKTDLATSERISDSAWLVTVKYSTRPADQKKEAREATGEPQEGVNYEIEFEAQAGTIHLTQSRRTKQVVMRSSMPNAGDAVPSQVDFAGAINDTGDEVAGVDFPPEADFKWSETHFLKNASVNDEYVRALEEMTGMVNDETFRNREPGCVLFRGVTGKRKDTRSYAFTFRFEAKRPLRGATLPSEALPHFSGVNADGYDLVWYRRVPAKSANGKRTLQVAVQCNVEEVAVRANFEELGVGVKGLDP